MQKPKLIDINNLIRQSEAARLLGVTKQAVNDRAKNKTITVVEIAGMKFVLRSELGLPKEKTEADGCQRPCTTVSGSPSSRRHAQAYYCADQTGTPPGSRNRGTPIHAAKRCRDVYIQITR